MSANGKPTLSLTFAVNNPGSCVCAYKIEEWLQLQVKLKSLNTVRWGEAQGVKWVENSQSSTSRDRKSVV